MTIIKPLLILLSSITVLVALASIRSALLTRLTMLGLYLTAVFLIARPDAANFIANRFGVGRGADLLLYLLALSCVLGFLALYRRLKMLEYRLTELARASAIAAARHPRHQQPNADSPNSGSDT
jgi:hypothetical protein